MFGVVFDLSRVILCDPTNIDNILGPRHMRRMAEVQRVVCFIEDDLDGWLVFERYDNSYPVFGYIVKKGIRTG